MQDMAHKIVLELPLVKFNRSCSKINLNDTSKEMVCDNGAVQFLRAVPVIVNFQKLLATDQQESVIQGTHNKNLLHAVAALYDRSLPDVTEDVIYSSIFEKWARTILLVQEYEDALKDFKVRELSKMHSNTRTPHKDGSIVVDTMTDKLVNAELKNANGASESVVSSDPKECESRFSNVFSDMESESENEGEDDDDVNYLDAIDEFFKGVQHRKEARKRWIKEHNCSGEPTHLLGIEHRLLGCATFEHSYEKPGHKVIQLTLIATRKRYRKMGIGRYMTKSIRNPALAGRYDAIVVNSDHSATNFFEKEGFSDDVLLNSKYADIGDTWYNCKRMCFLPPYYSDAFDSSCIGDQSTSDVYYKDLEDLDLKQMELDLALYQERSLQAFQAQSTVIQRLRKEVLILRARASAQSDTIKMLTKENHGVRDEKYACEKELLKLKLSVMTKEANNFLKLDEDSNVCEAETT
ncbi:uncharacterized protein LOC120344888 [Styela clava]